MKYNFITQINDKNQRLDVFLQQNINFTRSQIKKAIDENFCLVNGAKCKAGYKLQVGDNIEIEIENVKTFDLSAQNIQLDIVYQDDDLAIINKPVGLVVHPSCGNTSHTLVNALKCHFDKLSDVNGEFRPGIVHRLDKDTSGLLVIAKNNSAHENLALQIKNKTAKRKYWAICVGNLKQDEGEIDKNLIRCKQNPTKIVTCSQNEGRRAVTKYRVLERFNGYCLVEFSLLTGRTHQIRVHAKSLGHPISCDKVYGCNDKLSKKFSHQLLHAKYIQIVQPTTNALLNFEAPLPKDFEQALNILREK